MGLKLDKQLLKSVSSGNKILIETPIGGRLPHKNGIIIVSTVKIDSGCVIYHHVRLGANKFKDKKAPKKFRQCLYWSRCKDNWR